jgi:hypothetical protein
MEMPFGKHEGTPIEQLPEKYLWWLARTPEVGDVVLRAAIDQAWQAHLAAVRARLPELEQRVFRHARKKVQAETGRRRRRQEKPA